MLIIFAKKYFKTIENLQLANKELTRLGKPCSDELLDCNKKLL